MLVIFGLGGSIIISLWKSLIRKFSDHCILWKLFICSFHLIVLLIYFCFPPIISHSSIGMTKAALEAINGLNLFGSEGSSLSIIHVDPDAQYRNSIILGHLLPRESSSKETDASLLCITGYPAFAIDDPTLCKETEDRTRRILGVCMCPQKEWQGQIDVPNQGLIQKFHWGGVGISVGGWAIYIHMSAHMQ